jgi:O-antigen ligase
MPKMILFSLLFYLGTLSITQTAHGGRFLTLRWVSLAAFTGVSLLYWLMGRIPRRDALDNHGAPSMVWAYLLATLASVAMAQNYAYSVLRWLTHAMLIVTFMIFLRGTFHSRNANLVIWIMKGILVALLIGSFFFPAPRTVYDNPYFRGSMGDSNSMGHVAMLCALFFLHGGIVSSKVQWKLLQFGIAFGAAGILIFSWARSSMVAFMLGIVLLNYFYGLMRSFLAKSLTLLLVCLLLASPMIQSGILEFVAKDREGRQQEQPSQVLAVIRGDIFKKGPSFETVVETRTHLWSEAWEGFTQKPLLGWGFGANKDIEQEWSILPTSAGLVRDVTNDLLLTLEGSGLIGGLAYLGLMIFIFKQSLTRKQMTRIRRNPNEGLPMGEKPGPVTDRKERGALKRSEISFFGRAGKEKKKFINPVEGDHQQVIFYILSISLFALFQTDGSAFSAGSLISAVFWVCAGAAGALRAEAVVAERLSNRVEDRGLIPDNRGKRKGISPSDLKERLISGAGT